MKGALELKGRLAALAAQRRLEAAVSRAEVKALTLLPKNGRLAARFVQWGDNAPVELDGEMATAIATAFYAFVAMRWRAEKLSEAPLMVAQIDQEDGSEAWLPEHELAPLLEMPSRDYDMGDLLARTSHYVDRTGAAIWIVDGDMAGRPGRLTPFSQDDFEVRSRDGLIYGEFRVKTARGEETFLPEQVVYFAEPNAADWKKGTSLVHVAARWLQLGERARSTVWELLDNAVWPSLVSIPDPSWNPDKPMLEAYKQELRAYGAQKGQPFVALGGGQVQIVMPPIKDLIPADILSRVESAIASIFGVPAIVLQFQVGMENSPWSQMAQARRMAYDDTIVPRWRRWERIITRSLLRQVDEDATRVIRFDRTEIPALQRDRTEAATQAALMASTTSLNERRMLLGYEPSDDPAADEIPELRNRTLLSGLGGFGSGGASGGARSEGAAGTEEEDPDEEGLDEEQKALRRAGLEGRGVVLLKARRSPAFSRKNTSRTAASLRRIQREAMEFAWEVNAASLLLQDMAAIAQLADRFLVEVPEQKAADRASTRRFLQAVTGYLKGESEPSWRRAMEPLVLDSASRGAEYIAADLLVDFALVQPGAVAFAAREAGFLVTQVSKTTKQFVNDTVQAGLADRLSVQNIAKALQEGAGFSRDRARLIARTEVGRTQNGAAVEAVKEYSDRSGLKFEKVWRTALDDRVRDEHELMEGEAVPVDGTFSNGLEYPNEPNCRCVALIREVSA